MTTKNTLWFTALLLTLLCAAGCKKTEVPAAPQEIAAEQTPEQTEAPKAANPTDSANPTDAANQEKPANAVDFKSQEVPEIVTTATLTDTPWGKIKKLSVNWLGDIDISYEIPVFSGDSEAARKINDFMQKKTDLFFTKDNLAPCWEFEQQRHEADIEVKPLEEIFQNIHKLDVDVTDKYISVIGSYEWYMGGVNDYGTVPHVFDAKTGDVVSLMQVSGKTIEELRKLVTDALKAQYNDAVTDIEWDKIAKAEFFNFYIKDKAIHVVFVKYEIASGAAGGFDITLPIGIAE